MVQVGHRTTGIDSDPEGPDTAGSLTHSLLRAPG